MILKCIEKELVCICSVLKFEGQHGLFLASFGIVCQCRTDDPQAPIYALWFFSMSNGRFNWHINGLHFLSHV